MNLKDVTLLSQKFGMHSSYSGYYRLLDYMQDAHKHNVVIREKRLLDSAVIGLLKKVSDSRWLNLASIQNQWLVARESYKFKNKRVFHFLYGDNGFYYGAQYAKKKGHAVCATFHGTPEMLDQAFPKLDVFRHLDAIILVSKSQQTLFKKPEFKKKIHVIPHGIDLDYYSSVSDRPAISDEITCISTGFFARNYECIRRVAQALEHVRNIRFVIVSSAAIRDMFNGLANVRVYTGVTDDQLLQLYRQADIFLLSATGATANNSLLEALACGLPIVTENVGGIPEYLTEQCSIICNQGDVGQLANAINSLAVDKQKRESMGRLSRQKALEFGWPKIALRTQEVYSEIYAAQ